MDFILHPHLPFCCFPYTKSTDHVPFALVHGGDESSDALEQLCARARAELNLEYFDWFTSCGRDVLKCRGQDLHRLYEIVRWILNTGRRVYLQDGTQVNLNPEEHANRLDAELQQRLFLATCRRMEEIRCTSLVNLPIHRSDFWLIDEGKQWAEQWRRKNGLHDGPPSDDEGMFPGEYLQLLKDRAAAAESKELAPLGQLVPAAGVAAPDQSESEIIDADEQVVKKPRVEEEEKEDPVCVMCLDRTPNTLVLPCEHCVVCKQCSTALRTDPVNAKLCVYCRQNIEHVLE